MNGHPGREFSDVIGTVRDKCGKVPLSREELLLLACDEISRTTTYEELRFRNDPSCPE